MKSGLEGKSVIVTGGSSGIGRAAVLLLAEAGCDVTIADMDETGGHDVVQSAEAFGKGRAQFIRTDISNEDDVRAMVNLAVGSYGKLDGAINSAGIQPTATPMHEIAVEEWDRRIAINLRGTFLCLKHQVIAMRANGGGSIVAISSTAGWHQVPNSSEYCAAKAGINSLCRAAALENGRFGIRVNSVMPGATDTPMFHASGVDNAIFAQIAARTPLGRIAQPTEVAAAAVWMVSDHASFVSAVVVPVDGAITLG